MGAAEVVETPLKTWEPQIPFVQSTFIGWMKVCFLKVLSAKFFGESTPEHTVWSNLSI